MVKDIEGRFRTSEAEAAKCAVCGPSRNNQKDLIVRRRMLCQSVSFAYRSGVRIRGYLPAFISPL